MTGYSAGIIRLLERWFNDRIRVSGTPHRVANLGYTPLLGVIEISNFTIRKEVRW